MLKINSIIEKSIRAIKDGSFLFAVLNKFSKTKYKPVENRSLNEYLEHNYPGNGWKKLSNEAKAAWAQYTGIMNDYGIKSIAYAGAHEGDIAKALDDAFPGMSFILIEPVPLTFEKLAQNINGRQNMHCINCAVGEDEAQSEMFVDDFSAGSSLLEYENIALDEYSFLGNQKKISVRVRPLDNILHEFKADPIDLLFVDVQGYEDNVLKGAEETLKACKAVAIELSLRPLYKGSSTFDTVYQALTKKGFTLQHLIGPQYGKSRQILQIDGVFVRKS